ncbi:P63C domain-containing protein [Clostridium sp. JS66]|uniref:P63C domain-containing protein n=1 Tax=Clostridium sp. JS66 TaxID=3064705 RepID=UPI00298E855A|nr:P63C domain-containing protein [Clostridium sp. JS66]WPC42918.1 P63C domain-containing protein [Clostridium sp. JS66]
MKTNEVKITHFGKWVIDEGNNIEIDCYVTKDSRRLLSLRGTARAMGLKGGGSGALVRNLNSKWIETYLSVGLKDWLYKMRNGEIEKIKGNNGKEFYPFDCELFVDLCKAYVKADKDGVFENLTMLNNGNQKEIADRMLSIMSVFAKVGIVALIDEVTGYQYERKKYELRKLIAAYVREEFSPWTTRFPEEYYKEIFRLGQWEYKGKAKTQYVGKLTNKIVYEVLPESVLDELRTKNPIVENKNYRKHRHHQFLTEETGIPHLDRHLASIVTLMRACDNWEQFDTLFNRVFKKS